MIKRIAFCLFIIMVFPSVFYAASFKVEFLLGRVQYRFKGSPYRKLTKNRVLKQGTLIRTGRASIVRLVSDNENKILIRANSTFALSSLKTNFNKVYLYAGESEFRVKKGFRFQVRTPSLLAGVRGTLFKVTTLGVRSLEKVVVNNGVVAVNSLGAASNKTVLLKAREKFQWSPAKESFGVQKVEKASLEDLDFRLEEQTKAENNKAQDKNVEKEGENTQNNQNILPKNPNLRPADEIEEKPQAVKEAEKKQKEQKKSEKKLPQKEFFNFDLGLGGVRYDDGQYYHAFSFSPKFNLGKKLSLALFIPIYYDGKSDFFEAKKWGNYNEWDFKDSKDAIHDLLLKVKYFRFGENGDILFLALGSLDKVTLGSGFLMDNFENSPLYPTFRKIGLEAGFDLGLTGFHFFVNDVYDPEVLAGRFFFRPLFGLPFLGKFEIGIQAVSDQNPLADSNNPAFYAFALDFIYPVFKNRFLSLIFFADLAKQGIYYKDSSKKPATLADGTNISNFHINDNYGADIGFKGAFGSYFSFEFRYYYLHSGFVANYFDNLYLLNRAEKMNQVLQSNLSDAHALYFALSFKLPKMFEAGIGFYREFDSIDNSNKGTFRIKTHRGAFYKFWFSMDYSKKQIQKWFSLDENYKKNAVLDLKIGYMITNNTDLIIRKLINYDEDGNRQDQILLETSFIF